MDRVNAVRAGEIDILKYLAKLWALTNFTFACSPFLVTVVVFTLYTTIDPVNHVLDASKIFVSMSLFGLMRLPLTIFPWALTESIKLFVSLKRINKFLNAEVSVVCYPRKFRHDVCSSAHSISMYVQVSTYIVHAVKLQRIFGTRVYSGHFTLIYESSNYSSFYI
jgi:hypothetical protein